MTVVGGCDQISRVKTSFDESESNFSLSLRDRYGTSSLFMFLRRFGALPSSSSLSNDLLLLPVEGDLLNLGWSFLATSRRRLTGVGTGFSLSLPDGEGETDGEAVLLNLRLLGVKFVGIVTTEL